MEKNDKEAIVPNLWLAKTGIGNSSYILIKLLYFSSFYVMVKKKGVSTDN